MLSAQQEKDLIARCLQGNQKAQFELYSRYVSAMYNTAIRILGHSGEAQDVLQEGFSRVFQQLHTFRQESGTGTWIKRIVVNTALQHLRSRKQLQFVELNQQLEQIPETTDNFPDFDAETLHNAIKKLPDGARVIFILLDGLYSEYCCSSRVSCSAIGGMNQITGHRKIFR